MIAVCGVEIRFKSSSSATIAVRNCDETLPLGFVFTKVIKWNNDAPPGETVEQRNARYQIPADPILVALVNLKLTKIFTLGREMDALQGGYTALLSLEGNGVDSLLQFGGLS